MLTSKIMASQLGKQTITIQILPTSHEVKAIRQWQIFFFKDHAGNEAERLVGDLFLFFKKALYEVIESGPHLSFNIFQ